MGVYGEPLPFRVNGKVNLSKSTDIGRAGVHQSVPSTRDGKVNLAKSTTTISAGVCIEPVKVEETFSNQKQLQEDKVSFGDIFIAIIDLLDTMYSSFFEMRKDYLAFVVPAIVVLVLIGCCLLGDWLSTLLGEETGRNLAAVIVITLTIINAITPFVVHALNSVLHKERG